MRSPFPGMDPWMERHWRSVHNSFVQYSSDQLSTQLPEGLYASAEQTVYVVGTAQTFIPDAAVFQTQPAPTGTAVDPDSDRAAVATIPATEPVHIRLPRRNVSHRVVAIRDHNNGDTLVTAIELFSPTNKLDATGRRKYLKKRAEYYDAGISLVEVDLLRAGRHLIDIPLDELLEQLRTPYKACVHLGESFAVESDMTEKDYYPIPLRERLPRIRVPLRSTDPYIVLDLQQALDRTYDLGRFWMRVDYGQPPVPSLSPEDSAWANDLIRQWAEARR